MCDVTVARNCLSFSLVIIGGRTWWLEDADDGRPADDGLDDDGLADVGLGLDMFN